jgi:hypothetical protein
LSHLRLLLLHGVLSHLIPHLGFFDLSDFGLAAGPCV